MSCETELFVHSEMISHEADNAAFEHHVNKFRAISVLQYAYFTKQK